MATADRIAAGVRAALRVPRDALILWDARNAVYEHCNALVSSNPDVALLDLIETAYRQACPALTDAVEIAAAHWTHLEAVQIIVEFVLQPLRSDLELAEITKDRLDAVFRNAAPISDELLDWMAAALTTSTCNVNGLTLYVAKSGRAAELDAKIDAAVAQLQLPTLADIGRYLVQGALDNERKYVMQTVRRQHLMPRLDEVRELFLRLYKSPDTAQLQTLRALDLKVELTSAVEELLATDNMRELLNRASWLFDVSNAWFSESNGEFFENTDECLVRRMKGNTVAHRMAVFCADHVEKLSVAQTLVLAELIRRIAAQDVFGDALTHRLSARLALAGRKFEPIIDGMLPLLHCITTSALTSKPIAWRIPLVRMLSEIETLSLQHGVYILDTSATYTTDSAAFAVLIGKGLAWSLPAIVVQDFWSLPTDHALAPYARFIACADRVYGDRHPRRKLMWQHAFTTALVHFMATDSYATVSLAQLAVLATHDASDRQCEPTGKRVKRDLVAETVATWPLLDAQHATDALRQLTAADIVSNGELNSGFACSAPLNVARLPVQKKREDLPEARKYRIECTIVRVMKKYTTTHSTESLHTLIQRDCADDELSVADVEQGVKALQSRDYLSIDADGTIRYIP